LEKLGRPAINCRASEKPLPGGRLRRQSRRRVELAERLVEDPQFRIDDERAGQRDALCNAAGEFMRLGFLIGLQDDEAESLVGVGAAGLQRSQSGLAVGKT